MIGYKEFLGWKQNYKQYIIIITTLNYLIMWKQNDNIGSIIRQRVYKDDTKEILYFMVMAAL